jgi:predicted short-subunit dehydrogenase-like oxidoreductase (DUF2520 family)
MHPLQTIADAERAPQRLPGAWAAIEGMPRAMEAAEAIARAVGLRPFRVAPRVKAVYHAGAVFASNYFVVVEAVAQRLLRHAGLTDDEAWEALRPLVRGTLENMERSGPAGALTGPVLRADVATIARHLEALTVDDAILYRALRRAALELAQKRGMDDATAERVAEALATDRPPVLRPGREPQLARRDRGVGSSPCSATTRRCPVASTISTRRTMPSARLTQIAASR